MSNTPTLAFKPSKYKIAEMLVATYGYKNIKLGKQQLSKYCNIKIRTIDNWFSIEAGETQSINQFLIDKVCSFFNVQNESQLFTTEHKELLNKN